MCSASHDHTCPRLPYPRRCFFRALVSLFLRGCNAESAELDIFEHISVVAAERTAFQLYKCTVTECHVASYQVRHASSADPASCSTKGRKPTKSSMVWQLQVSNTHGTHQIVQARSVSTDTYQSLQSRTRRCSYMLDGYGSIPVQTQTRHCSHIPATAVMYQTLQSRTRRGIRILDACRFIPKADTYQPLRLDSRQCSHIPDAADTRQRQRTLIQQCRHIRPTVVTYKTVQSH